MNDGRRSTTPDGVSPPRVSFSIGHAVIAIRGVDGLSVSEKCVLYDLATRSGGRDGGKCWPSYATIGMSTGVHRRTVISAISTLAERGLIVVERRKDGHGDATSNQFSFPADGLGWVVNLDHHLVSHDHQVVKAGHHRSDPAPRPVVPLRHQGGDLGSPKTGKRNKTSETNMDTSGSELPRAAGRRPESVETKEIDEKPMRSDHQRVIAAFIAGYKRARGVGPLIDGRAGKAAKQLLDSVGVDEACSIIDTALKDDWVAANHPDLHYIATYANKWRGTAPRKHAAARLQQPATDDVRIARIVGST